MTTDMTSAKVRKALAKAASTHVDDPVIERLMHALDTTKLFRYHNDEPVNLLSTTGRVLMAIIEDPTLTQRAIAVYLGCSETLVDKNVKALVEAQIITKTKVNRKNVYAVDLEKVKSHSDIQHVGAIIDALKQHSDDPF